MNTRIDKVIRSMGFGFQKVYSLVLSDTGLYIIYTGQVGALKHYRVDETSNQVVTAASMDRSVNQLQANEARLDSTPLDDLLSERDNYLVRLEAIEAVVVKSTPRPQMIVKVTGSDHRFIFPFAPLDQVQTLQRALNKGSLKK